MEVPIHGTLDAMMAGHIHHHSPSLPGFKTQLSHLIAISVGGICGLKQASSNLTRLVLASFVRAPSCEDNQEELLRIIGERLPPYVYRRHRTLVL